METKKVFVPTHRECEFDNLKDAVAYVRKWHGGLSYFIDNIVKYNVRFRDCLREKGIDGVIEMLAREAPEIATDTKAIDNFKWLWQERMKEHIADYDIQGMSKDSRICIEGCWFEGLKDIRSHAELCGNPKHSFLRWLVPRGYNNQSTNLHVGLIWESYPVFDSSDSSDGRTYDNYVFSNEPLTDVRMEQYCKRIPKGSNACLVHEYIPEELLPILYYNGDSNYVLLATRKN